MLFSGRVGVRIRVMIRFSVWLVSCYAHVFVLGCNCYTILVLTVVSYSHWMRLDSVTKAQYTCMCKCFGQAFVDTNPLIKWCPFPGCGRAVRLNVTTDSASSQQYTLPMTSASGLGGAGARNSQQRIKFSRSVDCGSEHTFCWWVLPHVSHNLVVVGVDVVFLAVVTRLADPAWTSETQFSKNLMTN